ncbi:unnamed protein product [Malus baccata var. baccata]
MLKILNKKLLRLRWSARSCSRPKVVIKKFGKTSSRKSQPENETNTDSKPERPIRVVTFNAALFSIASAVPKAEKFGNLDDENGVASMTKLHFYYLNVRVT